MKVFSILAVACLALSGAACASINRAAGGDAPSVSPRHAAAEAARHVVPVMKEVSTLLAAGAISDNVADDISQFGPEVRDILSAYLDGAEACVVLGGEAQSDPASGGACQPRSLLTLYDQFDAKILAWAIETGKSDQGAAQVILGARLVVAFIPRPAAGGPFPGYRDEQDIPLDQFQAMRASWASAFETLLAAAEARAGRAT